MQADIDYPDGTQLEFVRIEMFNYDSSLAAPFLNVTPGFGIAFGIMPFNAGAAIVNYYSTSVSVDPTEITGDLLFQLSFDDTTNQFDAAFSFDGGTTFQTPFPSVTSSMGGQGVFQDWELDAFSVELQAVPEPSSVLLLGSAVGSILWLKRKITT